MIARIAVHLPQSLWLQETAHFETLTSEHAGERVVIHPPLQCSFEVRPDSEGNFNVNNIYRMLSPVANERVYPFVRMDGQLVKHANLLQVDVIGRGFRRESGAPPDPPNEFVEQVVMNLAARIRYTIGAPTFREFRLLETFWTVRYLEDDGADLPEEMGLVRGRVHAPFKFQFTGLGASSWAAVRKQSFQFQPHLWERLYLDALFLLPEVGPALTLAISAVETATDQMIEDRVSSKPGEAEKLISGNRLSQRLDKVSKRIAGVSLKDNSTLWTAFDRLRRARNMAAHEGQPILDGVVINDLVAQQMILESRSILDWVENLMRPELRSHRDPHEPKWEWRSPIHSSAPNGSPTEGAV